MVQALRYLIKYVISIKWVFFNSSSSIFGGGGGGGGGDQVPSAGLHVGGWVISSPKNTVSTWY